MCLLIRLYMVSESLSVALMQIKMPHWIFTTPSFDCLYGDAFLQLFMCMLVYVYTRLLVQYCFWCVHLCAKIVFEILREKLHYPLHNVQVQYKQLKLLQHPGVNNILSKKWNAFGLPLYILQLFIYCLFLIIPLSLSVLNKYFSEGDANNNWCTMFS